MSAKVFSRLGVFQINGRCDWWWELMSRVDLATASEAAMADLRLKLKAHRDVCADCQEWFELVGCEDKAHDDPVSNVTL